LVLGVRRLAAGQNMLMKKPMYPRDGAGSFTVPSERGDPIVGMYSLDDRLEIYTASETFMVQTPETIDPAHTNPNAPWINAKTHDVGSASPYVARTFIMASECSTTRAIRRRKNVALARYERCTRLRRRCFNVPAP